MPKPCRSGFLAEGSIAEEASVSEAGGHGDKLRQKRHPPSRHFTERASTFAEALAGESTGGSAAWHHKLG